MKSRSRTLSFRRDFEKLEDYDYGRFGHFLDPDGNKVELWEPKPGGFDTAEPAE